MNIEQILKKLVSFRTVTSDLRENKKAILWLKNEFKKFDLYLNEYNFNSYTSLVATIQKTKNPDFFLAAHIDVVPGPDNLFSLRKEKNKLIGRGVFDMKFAIACYLKLLEDLKEELKRYNFGIMITSDEEIGGYNGAKALLEEGYKAKFCFLPDGGNEFLIEKGAKGVWHLIIESYGKSSHGSRPWEGLNAIDQLIDFLNMLRKEFVSEPCKDKYHYHNTLNIGKIEGGEVANKVPDFATALIDIRFMPKENKAKLKNKIYKIKNKFKNIKIKEKVFGNGYEVDLKNPYIKSFIEIIERRFKTKPSFIISHGTSDARFFASKNIPVIVTRPRGGGHHSDREWVDIKSLNNFYIVLKEFVKNFKNKKIFHK